MKKREPANGSIGNMIMESKPAMLTLAILGIFIGIFFIVYPGNNKPTSRSEALSYSGEFESYEVSKNYRAIRLKDGSAYAVYPHTETQAFQDKMKSLEEGTKLYILVNPNSDYVAEIKTDSEELLNFELSQAEIDSYDNGYVALGILACVAGILLIVYVIGESLYKRKEALQHDKKRDKNADLPESAVLRRADLSRRSRILLEATVENYQICYRRIKSVNELVINGLVYDEKKGIIEFEHQLKATIDGHKFEAGYDKNSYSYISFDGKRVAKKLRLI